MPYETRWETEGVHWIYSGVLSDDDVLRSNLEIYDDPRFDTIRYQILNLLEVEEFAASTETMRTVSRMDKDQAVRNPNVKVAIVATAELIRGMANVYTLSAGDNFLEVQVFENEADAREWVSA